MTDNGNRDNTRELTKMPFVIAICSGKGGVGKSVIAANIAYALSESDLSVLVWDSNMHFPNQHLLLGVEPPIRLNDVYSGAVSLDKAIFSVKNNLFLLADLPASGSREQLQASDILDLYITILQETDFDVIIIDTPAGDTDEALQCCNIADLAVLVITDEPTSLIDAYGLIKILLQITNKDKLHLLVNNVIDNEDAEDISAKLNLVAEKFLKMKFDVLGYVPYDRSVRQSIMQQELLMAGESSEVTSSIGLIAEKIISKMQLEEIR